MASESCAIDAVGGAFVRDVEPGELVIINREGALSFRYCEKIRQANCSFEYIYFARPDSVVDGIDVYGSRIRAGSILARESPVAADLVIGAPDSGLPAAIGYSRVSGIAYGMGIVKSKYVGRTFIASDQKLREKAVSVKHNVISSEVRGKRVVIIDDSIVRGTTCRRLVNIIKQAGAVEVHVKISSPPGRFPCYFGIDTPERSQLISNQKSPQELCEFLGADSVAFISISGLLDSLGSPDCLGSAESPPGSEKAPENAGANIPDCGFCLGCFTGEYPAPVAGVKRFAGAALSC